MARGGLADDVAAFIAAAIEAAEASGAISCGGLYGDLKMPDPVRGACCPGSAAKGPQYCTCWVHEFDLEQQEPRPGEPGQRPKPCADCAYRAGSPELSGEERFKGDAGFLAEIVAKGQEFWCHQGMRRAVRLVHPSGALVDLAETGHTGDYQPPIVDGMPFKADGTPGELCAGWSSRRRGHLRREQAQEAHGA
jgi:hypothetical protein